MPEDLQELIVFMLCSDVYPELYVLN